MTHDPCNILYFAYGSNLSRRRLDERDIIPISARVCKVDGYALAFNKESDSYHRAANIVLNAGESVWGVAYELAHKSIERLDRFEGVHLDQYRRIEVLGSPQDGGPCTFATYQASESKIAAPARPTDEYLSYILEGAREHGLPPAYVTHIEKLFNGESDFFWE